MNFQCFFIEKHCKLHHKLNFRYVLVKQIITICIAKCIFNSFYFEKHCKLHYKILIQCVFVEKTLKTSLQHILHNEIALVSYPSHVSQCLSAARPRPTSSRFNDPPCCTTRSRFNDHTCCILSFFNDPCCILHKARTFMCGIYFISEPSQLFNC